MIWTSALGRCPSAVTATFPAAYLPNRKLASSITLNDARLQVRCHVIRRRRAESGHGAVTVQSWAIDLGHPTTP
jgi:hypothetical protein